MCGFTKQQMTVQKHGWYTQRVALQIQGVWGSTNQDPNNGSSHLVSFSGPVTITLAVVALWLWSRYWESIKITAQDLISQKELSLWTSQAPDIVWFPVLHYSLSFLFLLFLDLQLYLEGVLLNKFPFPHEGTYLSLLIGYRTTDHQVMLPFISQVAKETMNSEVTVPVSLSEIQYLFGRRPSNFSSALVSHPPDHKILQRLILLPNTGFTYLVPVSDQEQNKTSVFCLVWGTRCIKST